MPFLCETTAATSSMNSEQHNNATSKTNDLTIWIRAEDGEEQTLKEKAKMHLRLFFEIILPSYVFEAIVRNTSQHIA